jgi:hypothetical protein
MVTKLELYNAALAFLGPTRLNPSTGLTENRPDRYELDAVYAASLQWFVEQANWFFGLRSQLWEPDTDVDQRFGLPYTYSLPEDFVRIRAISSDEAQRSEDRTYRREGNYIFSSYSRLYLTYESNDASYGFNIGAYPQTCADVVACDLAWRSALPVTKDKGSKNDLLIERTRLLAIAKRKDAVDERVKGKPTSSWVNSRFSSSASRDQRRDVGSTGIGNGE